MLTCSPHVDWHECRDHITQPFPQLPIDNVYHLLCEARDVDSGGGCKRADPHPEPDRQAMHEDSHATVFALAQLKVERTSTSVRTRLIAHSVGMRVRVRVRAPSAKAYIPLASARGTRVLYPDGEFWARPRDGPHKWLW